MRFLQPETLTEAVDLLGEDPVGRKLIAGGVALVLLLHEGLIAPDALVSLARVPNLASIRLSGAALHIGSLTLIRSIAASVEVRQHFPVLAHACGVVGSARIRSQVTLGGNLADADYATDPPAALLALNAVVNVAGKGGERRIPLTDFFHGVHRTALAPGEIIASISIPLLPSGARAIYLKYKSRSSPDRPCVAVAAVAVFDGERFGDLRVAVGAACPTPRRLPELEGLANNQPLSAELIAQIAEGYAREVETVDDLRGSAWYHTRMIRVQVQRALEGLRDGRR